MPEEPHPSRDPNTVHSLGEQNPGEAVTGIYVPKKTAGNQTSADISTAAKTPVASRWQALEKKEEFINLSTEEQTEARRAREELPKILEEISTSVELVSRPRIFRLTGLLASLGRAYGEKVFELPFTEGGKSVGTYYKQFDVEVTGLGNNMRARTFAKSEPPGKPAQSSLSPEEAEEGIQYRNAQAAFNAITHVKNMIKPPTDNKSQTPSDKSQTLSDILPSKVSLPSTLRLAPRKPGEESPGSSGPGKR
jgi:hypothetical protein